MQRELKNVMTNNVFGQKAQQQRNTNSNIKILARAGNPGPFAPHADVLPLNHRVN